MISILLQAWDQWLEPQMSDRDLANHCPKNNGDRSVCVPFDSGPDDHSVPHHPLWKDHFDRSQ